MKMTQNTVAKMCREWIEPRGKSGSSWIEDLRLFVLREKAIYTNMNLLNIKNEIFEGYYWSPDASAHEVENSIKRLHNEKVNLPHTTIEIKDKKKEKSSYSF
jgi:hypothetical protein